MIQNEDPRFRFEGRNRRPTKDPCNALLSLAYTCLASECMNALESVGLDPYVGLLHGDRPGKPALALDLMEELRPIRADRFVVKLINSRHLTMDYFKKETDEIHLTKEGKKLFFSEWSKAREKKTRVSHMDAEVENGLLPFVQAKQLADLFSGRTDNYYAI